MLHEIPIAGHIQKFWDSLSGEEVRRLNGQFRSLDVFIAEMKEHGSRYAEWQDLYDRWLSGEIDCSYTVLPAKGRRKTRSGKRGRKPVGSDKPAFKAEYDSDGEFVWQEGK